MINPKGVIPYVILISAAFLVDPWWLLVAAAWWLVVECIL